MGARVMARDEGFTSHRMDGTRDLQNMGGAGRARATGHLSNISGDNVNRLMTVKGCVAMRKLNKGVILNSILLDTGALHGSYINVDLVEENRKMLEPFIVPVRVRVKLGDGKASVEIKEAIKLPIACRASSGRRYAKCITMYIMPLNNDAIIGLPHLLGAFSGLFQEQLRYASKVVEVADDGAAKYLSSEGNEFEIELPSKGQEIFNAIFKENLLKRLEWAEGKPPWEQEADPEPVPEEEEDTDHYASLNFLSGSRDEALDVYRQLLTTNVSPRMQEDKEFIDYMNNEALDVFVPSEWRGIKGLEPVNLTFDEAMPKERYVRARPVHPSKLEAVRAELARLGKYLYAKSTKSSIVSPIVVAKKATAPFIRIAIDYRWVNQYILQEQTHIPIILHEIERLKGFKVFTDADMTNSFHQLPLSEETSLKLSVISQDGVLRPLFLPEGCKPASGILHRTISDIFEDMRDYVVVIFDNLLIGAEDEVQLAHRTKAFLERCREYNIQLKMAKTKIGFDKVKFFGYEIDSEGYQIDASRHEALDGIIFPGDLEGNDKVKLKAMQSFLGFTLYFRHFVEGYAEARAPLDDMCKKAFVWDPGTWPREYRADFERLKELCRSSFKVVYPDFELPWLLQTDASEHAVGAILLQIRTLGNGSKQAEPIGLFSKKFSLPATRWATIKQEAYGIYAGVKAFEYWLEHKPFRIETDHRNLQWIEKSEEKIITRWRLFLQGYPIESILHVPGKDNQAADFLSRPSDTATLLELHESGDTIGGGAEKADIIEKEFSEILVDDPPTNQTYFGPGEVHAEIAARNALLGQETNEPLPPYSIECKRAIFKAVHGGTQGCFGQIETFRRLNESFRMHGISLDELAEMVRLCGQCQKNRTNPPGVRLTPMVRHLKVGDPRSTISIDGLKITPRDQHGYTYAHIIVNAFSKLVYIHPAKDQSAETAAQAIISYMATYGSCDRLISDNGSEYGSAVVRELTRFLGVRQQFTLVDRPQANGVTERMNAEVIRHLRQLTQDQQLYDRWSEPHVKDLIQFWINSTPKTATNISPFELHFGRKDADYFQQFAGQAPIDRNTADDFIVQLDQDIAALRSQTKAYYDDLVARQLQPNQDNALQQFQEGDLVLMDNPRPRKNKLDSVRTGPYRVIKQQRNDVAIRDLIYDTVQTVDVSVLSAFFGTYEEAFTLAQHDKHQFLVDRLNGFKGDPLKRTTMQFLVRFADGDERWVPYSPDIALTEAYETYCSSEPMLAVLLLPSKEVAKWHTAMGRLPITSIEPGVVFYADIRIYGCEYYDQQLTDIPDRHTRRYFVPMTVTQHLPDYKGKSVIEVSDNVFDKLYSLDNPTILRFAQYQRIDQLPMDSVIIDRDFVRAHPSLQTPFDG